MVLVRKWKGPILLKYWLPAILTLCSSLRPPSIYLVNFQPFTSLISYYRKFIKKLSKNEKTGENSHFFLLFFVKTEHTPLLLVTYNNNGVINSSYYAFNSFALMATMMVLKLINTAPTAGLTIIPHGAKTPAANGMANIL